jgi:sulfur carrier protein ThiS
LGDSALQREIEERKAQQAAAAQREAALQLAEATIAELTEEHGVSREQIAYLYNNDPNFRSAAAQEGVIALGRQRLAREGLSRNALSTPYLLSVILKQTVLNTSLNFVPM